jgi:tetratricopeptide (TPR) repeat protein
MLLDRMVESEAQAGRALRAAGPKRETEVIASTLSTLGGALPALGRRDESIALLRGALALADSAGHIDQALRARNNLLASAADDMPLTETLPLLDEGVDIARRYGFLGLLSMNLDARADAHFMVGAWDPARRDLEEEGDLIMSEGRRALMIEQLARLAAATEDYEVARQLLEEAGRHADALESAPQRATLGIYRCMTLLLLGEPEAALREIASASGGGQDTIILEWHAAAAAALGDQAALDAARARPGSEPDAVLPRVVARHVAAVAASLAGRWDEARVEYERTIAGYHEMGYELDAVMTGLAFDAYLGARFADARQAGGLVRRARRVRRRRAVSGRIPRSASPGGRR